MGLNKITYPCLVGTIHGVIRINNYREIRGLIHEFVSSEIAVIKNGYNDDMKVKFILTSDGVVREFIPKKQLRSWAKYFSDFIDLSRLECCVISYRDLNREEISTLFKKNITSLDRHFNGSMKAYKILKNGSQDTKLSCEELKNLLQLKA